MSRVLPCLACGIEGHDVAVTLVEVPDAEQRVVDAATPVSEDQHGVAGFEYSRVRERFIAEPRCRDTTACAARVAAFEPTDPSPPSPADAAEETAVRPSWMPL